MRHLLAVSQELHTNGGARGGRLLRYRREGGVPDQEQERPANFGEFSWHDLRQLGTDLLPDCRQGIDLGAILLSYGFVSRRVANQLQDLAGGVNGIGAMPGVADSPRNSALECPYHIGRVRQNMRCVP